MIETTIFPIAIIIRERENMEHYREYKPGMEVMSSEPMDAFGYMPKRSIEGGSCRQYSEFGDCEPTVSLKRPNRQTPV